MFLSHIHNHLWYPLLWSKFIFDDAVVVVVFSKAVFDAFTTALLLYSCIVSLAVVIVAVSVNYDVVIVICC